MINVGDKVKVVYVGAQYDTFSVWADRNNLKGFVSGNLADTGAICTVIAKEDHGSHTKMLYGIRDKNGVEYIFGERGIELVEAKVCNGVDADGNPLNFTTDTLEYFMRVKTHNGGMYIVTPHLYSKEFAVVDSDGCYATFRTPDNRKEGQCEEYDAVEIYEAPYSMGDVLNPTAHGSLIWKYVEPVVESEMGKRVAFFQTHIDAVKENLASLEAEFQKLKQGV